VTKRKAGIVAFATLLVLAAIVMSIPLAAGAAITSGKWSGAAYQGYDEYYAATVVAFEAGTTAKVEVQVYNDQGVDVTIKEAKIDLDWGATHAATVAPAMLRTGETGIFTFEVPVPDTASNAVLHNYKVTVGYQKQDTSYVTSLGAANYLGMGNGVTNVFTTSSAPVLATSLKVYWRNTVPDPDTITLQDASTYVLLARTGRITFGAPPPAGTEVWADYQYFENAGSGNGLNKVFFTNSAPVVDGSLMVYLANTTTDAWAAATGWTADLETGKVTLASAPTSFESVYVTYEYWSRWPVWSATNLAVFTADQVAARALISQYNDMYRTYIVWPSSAGEQAEEEADVLAGKAYDEYVIGDFAAAAADYQAAVDKMQEAIGADTGVNSSIETGLTGVVTGAGSVVDAYGAKLNAEAQNITDTTKAQTNKLNGEASLAKNLGVFTILIGVATLLAGIAGIIWAFSRYVDARGPAHHEHT
jgi:hypothetical protein